MKRPLLWFILVPLILSGIVLGACGARAMKESREREESTKPAAVPSPAPTMAPGMPAGEGYDMESTQRAYILPGDTSVVVKDRMVISTAQLSIIVDDVEITLPRVQSLVKQMEGYIVGSQSYRTASDRLAATVTLRVPANRFLEALDQLRGMARKVEGESQSGEDVTNQYVDLEARLKALQATENELLALLSEVRRSEGNAEQKAQAILAIYNQLTSVRSQIEQIQGQMKYLEQMSAMATITVELKPYEPKVEQPVVEEGFRPSKTLREAARTLVKILQRVYELLIRFVVVLLPVLAILGLPAGLVWIIIWWWRRQRRQRAG